MVERKRSINWLQSTENSLASRHPNIAGDVTCLTERLATVLLHRLTTEMATQLMDLLPPTPLAAESDLFSLRQHARSEGDKSIGYMDFVEKARNTLDLGNRFPSDEVVFRALADSFLWAVIQEIPPEIKGRLAEELPLELRSRMDLYSAHSAEDQVA